MMECDKIINSSIPKTVDTKEAPMNQIPNIIINYFFPPAIQFGFGAIANLGMHLQRMDAKRALIVTDKGIVKAGILAKATSSLDSAKIDHFVFDGVQPNPTDKNVDAGISVYRDSSCDSIIGLGGGSAMDAAKGIRVMSSHEGEIDQFYSDAGGIGKITPDMPSLISIPTTAGTGSEVSAGAIITDTKQNRKRAIISIHNLSNLSLLDPLLTQGMPPGLTASTGMDALSHSVEAYVTTRYHPISEGIALKATEMIGKNLRRAVEEGGDIQARGEMLMASTMGALAFQKGLGAVHSLAHQLSTEADIPHGVANSIMLPYVMEFNLEYAKELYADIASALGADITGMSVDEAAHAGIAQVRQLSREIGVPQSLSEVGLKRESLQRMAKNAMLDHCCMLNPRPCTEEDMLRLYEIAF